MQDNIFGDIIHAYTRADAIADGVLHDVSHLARETGFHHPVAVAAHAWDRTVTWDHDDTSQDETGRLWDVLTVALAAFRRAVAVHIRLAEAEGDRRALAEALERLPRAAFLVDGAAAVRHANAAGAALLAQFWLRDGHPAYPVFWDFAFVIAGSAGGQVFIGSSSD